MRLVKFEDGFRNFIGLRHGLVVSYSVVEACPICMKADIMRYNVFPYCVCWEGRYEL